MVGDGRNQAVNLLIVEKLFVTARNWEVRLARDFAREGMAAVIQVASGDALRAGKLHGRIEQSGTLHSDADDSETQPVARRNFGIARRVHALVAQKQHVRCCDGAGSTRTLLEEFTTRKISLHRSLLVVSKAANGKRIIKTFEF